MRSRPAEREESRPHWERYRPRLVCETDALSRLRPCRPFRGCVDHLYLMIDQLEDLATTRTITAAKRSREIGRIRDMLEGPPYVNRVHFILTFHNRAAQVLDRFWEENRLPPFEISPSNIASVVVLRGLKDDDQVSALLRVYLEEQREGPVEDDLLPFEPGAVTVLREVSDGRVGILLNRARGFSTSLLSAATPG